MAYLLGLLAALLDEAQLGRGRKPDGQRILLGRKLVDIEHSLVGRQEHRAQISCHAALGALLQGHCHLQNR